MPSLRVGFGRRLPPLLSSGWQLQDAAKVRQTGKIVSSPSFAPAGWFAAVVPGTVLTTLVDAGLYPEPLYGENNRPDKIPESLCRTSYWYRTRFKVPAAFAGRRVWLNFAGINYTAAVWVNGREAGEIRGAFARGAFDVTAWVAPGAIAAVAVLIRPPPHPHDNPPEQTVILGLGPNGGVMSRDGPTFLCSQGWDWIPAIRDRNMGIWQKVTLAATGPVVLKDPGIDTVLPLPAIDRAEVSITATLQNHSEETQAGMLRGKLGPIRFAWPFTLAPRASSVVRLTPKNLPQLRIAHPRLWWPNGFGAPNLYPLELRLDLGGTTSDAWEGNVGLRQITYAVPGSKWLTLGVNGVPVFCKGGNWGMDEAMKRIPRERLEAQIRYHREAHFTMIRNWVGQSTSEDFYDLCDRSGLLVWDEFFQPNPSDSGREEQSNGDDDIADIPLYLANVREKVLRFRHHPCIALWCGRNEGDPTPAAIAEGNQAILAELDPHRLYQANSTAGRGVRSHGPYGWRPPAAFYRFESAGPEAEVFKSEIGIMSVPTLESVRAMLAPQDWEAIGNDAWAEHDMAHGNNHGDTYPATLAARYGPTPTLAAFVRAAQLANYEAFRAMYEGRQARLFRGSTGVLTWMSNPAQPSFTHQIYSHDLEPFASFFAVRRACEPVHVQLNEDDDRILVINHTPRRRRHLRMRLRVFNLEGRAGAGRTWSLAAPPSAATAVGAVKFPADGSAVHFVHLDLRDARGRRVSENFYWRGAKPEDLTALLTLPEVTLEAKIGRRRAGADCALDVTLKNPGTTIALLAHLQLRRANGRERVLPVSYSDNYLSLLPGETRTVRIEAAAKRVGRGEPVVVLDGWNVTTTRRTFPGVARIAPNPAARAL